ncbi:hypothetical protein C0991_001146, partial [Blastosporella zonata]
MRWTAPPDRREKKLLVFAFSVFFLSYNFENSLRLLGFDPATTYGTISRSFSFGRSNLIAPDGRRPPGWRDSVENEIFGTWAWEEGQVAGDGAERTQRVGEGNYSATWLSRKEVGELRGGSLGQSTVNDGFLRWGEDIPQTKLVRHVSGYSILDNVIIFDGTVYVVTDDRDAFPSMTSIVTAAGLGMNEWKVISTATARKTLGTYGAIPSGQTTLAPPTRLFFPQVRVFTDPNPLPHFHTIRRRRVDTGFHPFLLKAAFPQLTVMYQEDWEDYHKLPVPFVIKRIVVADREAAEAAGKHILSPAFDLPGTRQWWEPIRHTLLSFLSEPPSKKKVVTYIHRQSEKTGVRLLDEDHEALVRALQKLGRDYGYETHIVSSLFDETNWAERMSAVVKSTVLLGPYSTDLLDCLFMKPSPQPTLMEFFPTGTFARDEELVAESRGVRYVAWWNEFVQ